MKKNIILIIFIVILVIAILGGLFNFLKPEKQGQQQKVVMTSSLWSRPEEQEFFKTQIIQPFTEKTGIEVEFQILSDDDILKKVELQNKSGNIKVDIMVAHSGKMPIFINEGFVKPLTAEVQSWKDRQFFKAFEKSTNMNGEQYFIPIAADVYLLLANVKAMKYLPADADIDRLTWDQYAEWANNIARGEGEGKAVVTGIPMKSLIYQFGGLELSYGANFLDLTTPEAKQAWQIWAKMSKAFIPDVKNIDDCTEPMKREEAWLTVFHNARAGLVYATNETKYILAPAPRGPKGIGTIAGASGFGLLKGAPNQEGAIILMEYLTRPEVMVELSKGTGGFIPPVKEAFEYLGDSPEDEIINKAAIVLDNGVVSGVPSSLYKDWGSVKKIFDDLFAEMILEQGKVSDEKLEAAKIKLDALKK